MINTPLWPTLVAVCLERSWPTWLLRVFDPTDLENLALDDVREVELLRINAETLDDATAEVERVLALEEFTLWVNDWDIEVNGPFGANAAAVFARLAVN